MKSIYTCPACGAKTLEWMPHGPVDDGYLQCQNMRCASVIAGDGVRAQTEAEAYEQLKRRVEEEK